MTDVNKTRKREKIERRRTNTCGDRQNTDRQTCVNDRQGRQTRSTNRHSAIGKIQNCEALRLGIRILGRHNLQIDIRAELASFFQ